MFKGFKNKSITKAVESHLKKRQVYSKQVQLNKLAVLIDARYDIDIVSVMKLSSKLGVKPKNVKIIGLKHTKAYKEGQDTESASYFNESQFSYAGGFKSKVLNDFVDESYDVLINFYPNNIPYLNLVAAASQAKFKVGFSGVDNRINDLVIGTAPDNTDLFISELKKYLKILNIIWVTF